MCALFSKPATEQPREALAFQFYDPKVQTDQLVPGIDNIRFDVSISAKFLQCCQDLIAQLIAKHSDVSALLNHPPPPPRATERKEFKQQFQSLLINALNHANGTKNPQLELLAQASVVKALHAELQSQYALVVLQAREKLRLFDSPTHAYRARGYQLQELFSNFQRDKRVILRRVGQELLEMMEEVRGEVVQKTRESFFGSAASEPLAIFSQPLLFTEDGKDDYLYLQHYIMLGNFARDPDRFEVVEQQVQEFLEWADGGSPEAREYRSVREAHEDRTTQLEALRLQAQEHPAGRRLFPRSTRPASGLFSEANRSRQIDSLEARLRNESERLPLLTSAYRERLQQIQSAPQNATLLVDYADTERRIAELEKTNGNVAEIAGLQRQAEWQREALEHLFERFSRSGLIPFLLAAYETAKIHRYFCPPINPQQLKSALVDAGERKKVAHLTQEYRLPVNSLDTLEEAARRVRDAGGRDVRAMLVRFTQDFFRCQQNLRRLRLAQELMEQIHLPTDPKRQELSEINNTLYHFLLPEEEKPLEDKVTSHVILKADIRDSTSITAQLLARGLNPASYFSLNFFDPVRKLLPRFGASKVFLEGDALILAIMENEGDAPMANSVARACALAREVIEGLRIVNDRAAQNDLPLLECGIGISYQPSPPMYLMDGERPIMISRALNESDRLSGCGRLAKELLTQKSRFFNVFAMQLLPEADSRGASEEFRLHYNVQGIEISEPAFEKIRQEISLSKVELKLPLFGEPELVEFYCGSLPLGASGFQKIVVRRGRMPQLDPKTLHIVEHTNRYYYELCTARPVYDYVGKRLGW